MTSLTEFFNKHEDDALKGISHKNSIIKRNIIAHMAVNGECTLSELTKQLHISVPTITKLVQELVEENIVTDNGKVETPGGRRPNIYGLANSAIYFVGVNVGRDFMAGMKTLVGGEITGYTEMLVEARQIATKRMVDAAEALGADAAVGLRYASASVMQGAAEVIAYGTAVKFK